MTMESDLSTLLKTKCARVFPDVAPSGTALPYVTWQGIGGESISFLDNTAGDKRNVLVQINGWSSNRLEALQLIRAIEDVMRASTSFVCRPIAEPISLYEGDTQMYGCIQRFSIYATR